MRYVFLLLIFATNVFSQTQPPIGPGVSQELAKWRAARYSDVRYKLDLTLEKMSPVLKGTIEIRVNVSEPPASAGGQSRESEVPPIVLDWRRIAGHESLSMILNVSINGKKSREVDRGPEFPTLEIHDEHFILRKGVVYGENVIKLDFTSPILTSGSAITRYVDKEDGAEYIYSLFVPSDASTAFPVFDQPDLKARFTVSAELPLDWNFVTNQKGLVWDTRDVTYFPAPMPRYGDGKGHIAPEFIKSKGFHAKDTKPISTYVFAFAAGPWEQMSGPAAVASRSEPPALAGGPTEVKRSTFGPASQSDPSTAGVVSTPESWSGRDSGVTYIPPAHAGGSDTHIYVRKSQAAKFKPHAAEVFRLNREGTKYLETYFDYKFPFPKYDLVLIPEFPFGGMEHAGATFLRESSIIFPTEPTKGDYISRANLIFHETAHQWFGDTVTMKWFDDLWLKEGFAEFMAYKTLEKVMPEANAWKVFYERNKQAAYATDSTKGTTPIYQEIANLNSAKSAYGNIVYRKAPSFLRQAEFYLGEGTFQRAVRSFLKKYEFANAGWEDLVKEFEGASKWDLKKWARTWVTKSGVPIVRPLIEDSHGTIGIGAEQKTIAGRAGDWPMKTRLYFLDNTGQTWTDNLTFEDPVDIAPGSVHANTGAAIRLSFAFSNYGDYGYGIFLLDPKSRDYVLKHIGEEKDPFLRSMMWGSLWDSVREGEMDPREYVELVVKQLGGVQDAQARASARAIANRGATEADETIIQSLLGRVSTAMSYYLSEPPALAGGKNAIAGPTSGPVAKRGNGTTATPPAYAGGSDLRTRLEDVLIDRMQNAETPGQRITFYRAFVANASTEHGRTVLKAMLRRGAVSEPPALAGGENAVASPTSGDVKQRGSRTTRMPPAYAGGSDLRTKDKFDIVTRLIILGDPDAAKLLADLEKTETSDDAKRYAYAARAGFGSPETKAKFWTDYTANKDISESWIETSLNAFNSIRHADLTLPYLGSALAELPRLKRDRKIFFVNNWLAAFIGGQRSQAALDIVNKFLADNPGLDKDLRLKILENVDLIERAVRIRAASQNRLR